MSIKCSFPKRNLRREIRREPVVQRGGIASERKERGKRRSGGCFFGRWPWRREGHSRGSPSGVQGRMIQTQSPTFFTLKGLLSLRLRDFERRIGELGPRNRAIIGSDRLRVPLDPVRTSGAQIGTGPGRICYHLTDWVSFWPFFPLLGSYCCIIIHIPPN